MKIVRTIDEANFLLTLDSFAVDIETKTTDPHEGWKKTFGLSYCAPITWVSFYAEGFPAVVFDMRHGENVETIAFIKKVMSRSGITIIAHNATFDLRSLGGQYDFTVHLDSRVWDTQTMAILLLMGEAENEEIALASLAQHYGVIREDTLTFLKRMKEFRTNLDAADPVDVLQYVALDSVVAYRLYLLQKEIIAQSSQRNASVRAIFDKDVFTVSVSTESKSNVPSTKGWKTLPELVDWETRISRWSANAAIKGIRLDLDYVNVHLEQLTHEYGVALKQVLGTVDPTSYVGFDLHFCTLLWYEELLNAIREGKRKLPDPTTRAYWVGNQGSMSYMDVANYLLPNHDEEWTNQMEVDWLHFLTEFPALPVPQYTHIPRINLHRFIHLNCYPDDPYGYHRATYKLKWLTTYYTSKTPISPDKMVNKPDFQKYYTFCVEMRPFPDNREISRLSDLVTTELKKHVEDDENEQDYHALALKNDRWSMCEKALKWYFPKVDERDANEPEHPFRVVSNHVSKMNRIAEFMRHAERDGRIHSMISRKTRTGRASSSSMNLQNISMKYFRGYLVPDNDERVLGGIDVSNAENWTAALTFGDDALAMACASGDFHSANTHAYWPERARELDERIAAGDDSATNEFNDLRKLSKFITFGGAYGAGSKKIARMVGCSRDEAQQILNNRDISYPRYAAGKKIVSDMAEQCWKDGNNPSYTVLWTGRRISMPMFIQVWNPDTEKYEKQYIRTRDAHKYQRPQVAGYKAANYRQQGGVGEIIWRALVLASEYFERNNIDASVGLQIHDEIVFDTTPALFFDVARMVIEIIANIVPPEILARTKPACRMLSEIGPENSKKWGWRYDKVYPIDKTLFANRWGVHQMPDGETEAPTWIGDYTNGYTLEGELMGTASDGHETEGASEETTKQPKTLTFIANGHWNEFRILYNELYTMMELFSPHLQPATLKLSDGQEGTFLFPERMVLQQQLYHKGHDVADYHDVLEKVEAITAIAGKLNQWRHEAPEGNH